MTLLTSAATNASTPANDNVAGTITPDDRRFFLSLALVSAVILALALYVALSPPADDVMSLLRR